MIKRIRERIWFIQGFLKKYTKQILISLGLTVALAIVGNSVISKLPQSKQQIKIGIIGQYQSGQLPPLISDFLNAGLISINENQEVIPNIAEKWEIQDNGNTYIFYLKPDLVWQTGEKVKASDIKFAIPNITTEATDPNILKFTIPTKFSPFLSLLNIPLLNHKGKTISQYDIKLRQKSSGILTEIILESKKQKITINIFSTARQAITAFKLGQLDLILDLPSEYKGELNSYAKIKEKTDFSKVVMIIFNQKDPNLKEKNTRKGIAYGIKNPSFGHTPSLTTINPTSWAFSPLVKTYSFNKERVKEYIKSPISLELVTTPELLPTAEIIKSDLQENNINLTTRVVTSTPEQFQLFLTTYNIPTDPDQYRDWHSTQATNIGGGVDEKIDKLLEDGRVNLDQKQRKQIYMDFQKAFSEELPSLVLYHPSTIYIARKDYLLNLFP